MNVLIVDDEVANRKGAEALLADDPELIVVGAIDHDQALERTDWEGVHTVLLDAGNTHAPLDQVPGAVVATHIRRITGRERPVIIVVTHFSRQDNVMLRMRAAGADFFYDRSWLMQTPERLLEHVRSPSHAVPPLKNIKALKNLGITDRSDPNAIIEAMREIIAERDLDPAYLDKDAVSRRKPTHAVKERLRRRVSRRARVEPVKVDGSLDDQVEDPSVHQLRRLWTYLTKLDR